jgi:type II secretory pathway pseudopilin PulG
MLDMIFRRNQRGDTIMEVIICVAVIGLVLTAAFALSNRSTTGERKAQERGSALKIAESQMELLKSYADLNKLPSDRSQLFCMEKDSSASTGVEVVPITGTNVPIPSTQNDNLAANYPDECKIDGEGYPDLYSVAIWSPDRSPSIGGTNVPYGVTVRWEGAGGSGHEELKMFYNIYDVDDPGYRVEGDPPKLCIDGIDNDGDTRKDYPADPGCTSAADNDETNPQCNDEFDNDGDGRNNAAGSLYPGMPTDPGCIDLNDNSEINPQCNDDIDNDGDGRNNAPASLYPSGMGVDQGCTDLSDDDETNPRCDDNLDNDGDGKKDYPADRGCDSKGDDDEFNLPLPPVSATASEASHQFPSWHLIVYGGSSDHPTATFTFRNPSSETDLQLTSANITGGTSSFAITSNGCEGRRLAAGATCNVTVVFWPPSGGSNNYHNNAGMKTATLVVNNSSGVSTTSVSLRGMTYSDRLAGGDTLRRGQSLVAYHDSCYVNVENCLSWLARLDVQDDGNLAMYKDGYSPWSTGYLDAYRLEMQNDGNLVLYDSSGNWRWQSNTYGQPNGTWLKIHNGGIMDIFSPDYTREYTGANVIMRLWQ